jgi:protein-disulfide isomerase/uncharacterized membrane protein
MDNTIHPHKARISWPTLLLSALGFVASLYAFYIHLQGQLQPGKKALCDINATMSCSTVINSSWGEVASIPLGAYGMSYFAVVFCLGLLPQYLHVSQKWIIQWLFLAASIGLFVAGFFFYISFFKIGILCPTCLVIQSVCALLFLYQTFCFMVARHQPSHAQSEALFKLILYSTGFALPPLVAGLFIPIALESFVPASSSTPPSALPTTSTPSPESFDNAYKTALDKLLKFNKTNFIGNGEDYRNGNDTAPVIVNTFSEFGCPHCRTIAFALEQAQKRIGYDKVIVIHRFFPYSNACNPHITHGGAYPYSCTLVEAARCAGQQQRFLPFIAWGFQGQDWTEEQRQKQFSLPGLKAKALEWGVNGEIFERCINSHVEVPKIQDDAQLAHDLKIEGTPLVFINTQEYKGGNSVEDFVKALAQHLL